MPVGERRSDFSVRLMLGLAMAALVCAIASRAVQLSMPVHAVAQCDARAHKVQQLACDAHEWSAPVAAVVVFLEDTPSPAVSFEPQAKVARPLYESLYNRPPPVA